MEDNSFTKTLKELSASPTIHLSHLYLFSNMDEANWHCFQEYWPTISDKRRREIMTNLVQLTEENFELSFRPIFEMNLQDADGGVRAAAINGLWEDETPYFVQRFINMLQTDSVEQVRATAAIALGRYIYLHEVEELADQYGLAIKQALLDTIHKTGETVEVRRRALEAVSFSSDATIPGLIEAAYYDEEELLQISAVFSMGRNADARWIPHITNELDNPNPALRYEAARACGELEARQTVEKLVELIEHDPDLEVQEAAIGALGHIGGQTARQILEACTDLEVEVLAQAAQDALEEISLLGDDAFNLFDFDDNDEWDDEDDDWFHDDLDDEKDTMIPLTSTQKHPRYMH